MIDETTPAAERQAICELLGADPFAAQAASRAAAKAERDRRSDELMARLKSASPSNYRITLHGRLPKSMRPARRRNTRKAA